MKNNICNFIERQNTNILSAVNFVYETNSPFTKNYVTPDHKVFLVTNGTGTFSCKNEVHKVRIGTLIFLKAGTLFNLKSEKDFEIAYISFNGLRANELFLRFNIDQVYKIFFDYESLIPFWTANVSRSTQDNTDIIAESVLLYTFSCLTQSSIKPSDVFVNILHYTEENFTDFSLTLNTIAEKFHYNPKYVSQLFKKKLKINFSEHLKNLRLNYALTLFDQGLTSIKNVSILCGYLDPLYFSKQFKNQIGLSPKEYIKRKHPNTEE